MQLLEGCKVSIVVILKTLIWRGDRTSSVQRYENGNCIDLEDTLYELLFRAYVERQQASDIVHV